MMSRSDRKTIRPFRNQEGFSLVEMSIVIIVSGIMTLVIISFLNMYKGKSQIEKTMAAVEMAKYASQAFFAEKGYYPCPADITLPQSDPNYGVENRDAGTGLCLTTVGFPAVNGRDVNGINGIEDSEKILIGGIPYKTLSGELEGPNVEISSIRQNDIVDGWGRQLTYLVTKGLTVDTTFDDTAGAIEVKDETDRSLLDTDGSAHAVFISHGKNGRGGYDRNGFITEGCGAVALPPPPPPLPPTPPPTELENCDHDDNTVLSGLRTEVSFAYNDDIVGFMLLKKSELWKQTGAVEVPDPANPANKVAIPLRVAANKGNVGIGIADPQKELDVKGDLEASEFWTGEVCDAATSDFCVPPEYIDGEIPDMKCPDGQVVTRIEGAVIPLGGGGYEAGNPDKRYPKVFCTAVAFSPPAPGSTCPGGKYVAGITSSGGLICRP